MNIKSYQGFSGVDFLGVAALVSLVILISWPIVARQLEAEKVAKATLEVERLASRDMRTFETGRSPSSEITVGSLDPWGHSYLAKILRNAYGQETFRMVWSLGPNGTNDTDVTTFNEKLLSHDGGLFGGDDIGFVEKLR